MESGWATEAKTHPVFEALDEAQWERVKTSARIVWGRGREPLFRQGDAARRFFWVSSGLVQLSRTSPSGQEHVLEVIRPHQLFAEALIFMGDEVRYPVDAAFVRPSRLVAFDNQLMRGLVRDCPELALRMLGAMAQRIHKLVNAIDGLTLHTATERVAQGLIEESREREAFTLDIPKRTLAGRLALTPESLSRVLAALQDRHLIDVQRDSVRILDRGALEALASGET